MCPISQNLGHRHYQAGIVSWGMGCGGKAPGVYTNVAVFRDWIDHWFAVKGFDTSFYSNLSPTFH